jgi:hypothetical protein
MKTVLVSILLALLIVATSTPTKLTEPKNDVDEVLLKCESNLSKASTVAKVADKQQKEKMDELHETIQKLETEKKQLETTLTKTKYELQNVKHIDSIPIDTGEHFHLFPED